MMAAMGPMIGPCLIVYNLDVDRLNCDRVFSLFGLYGDVVKVRGRDTMAFVHTTVPVVVFPS